MEDQCDYKRFAVLYVDDEEKSLKLFSRAFSDTFWILTAASAQEGLRLLEEHKHCVGILMTDQRMPGEKGVWLLDKARQVQPRLVRILATAYSDMDAAIAAVNSGSIYKYITKPWDPVQLDLTLKRGLEYFMVQHERDQLLTERVSVLQNMMMADRIVSLGLLAAGLSHHIRNALVAVKTFLDLAPAKMQEEKRAGEVLRNPEFWNEYYQSVQGQIQRINRLLKELGAASEDTSSQFQDEVQLDQVVAAALTALAEPLAKRGLTAQNQIPSTLPLLRVDKPKFCRLFELLLRDEMVSLPAGSTISFSARLVEPAEAACPEIEIRIEDDGPGLPEEAVRLLFDPFVVRSESPMEFGINLMACYFIVHHHGGKIRATSEKGRGTTFTLRLPTQPSTAPAVQEQPGFRQRLLQNQGLWEKLASA